MSEELRECPFCGGTRSISVLNFFTGDSFRKCDICGAEAPEGKTTEEAVELWNHRPVEDALKAEVEELQYLERQFKNWGVDYDAGCPKHQYPNYPCKGEKMFKERFGEELIFDTTECLTDGVGCWVAYYRWKYRQKVGKDTNASANVPDTNDGKMEEK